MYCLLAFGGVTTVNKDKKEQFLNIYKKYKSLMHYIESNYKLTMNDVAILELIEQNCSENNMLMQPFLKIATTELELSRTKVLASIRRLIDQDRVSKIRSTEDERKVYLFMNNDNAQNYKILLDDIEGYVK
nr:MarR family transcriptional regulator [Staphylococcus xylosus]